MAEVMQEAADSKALVVGRDQVAVRVLPVFRPYSGHVTPPLVASDPSPVSQCAPWPHGQRAPDRVLPVPSQRPGKGLGGVPCDSKKEPERPDSWSGYRGMHPSRSPPWSQPAAGRAKRAGCAGPGGWVQAAEKSSLDLGPSAGLF